MSSFVHRAALGAVIAALLATPAAASAAQPVTKVLNGGTLRYSGSVSGTEKGGGTADGHDGSASVAWDSSYPIAARYDGQPGLMTDGDHPMAPWRWSSDLGSERSNSWYTNSKGAIVNDSCSASVKELLDPPNYAGPGDVQPDGTILYSAHGTQSVDDVGNCSAEPHKRSPYFDMDTMVDAIGQDFVLPKTPIVGAMTPKKVSFSGDLTDGHYEGGGTISFDCLLCVDSITVEETDYPGTTRKPMPDTGTTDGNVVWVTAKIRNTSTKTWKSMVQLNDPTAKRQIFATDYRNNNAITFPAGATTTVEWPIDTEGMAWQNGQPKTDHQLEVLTALGGGRIPFKVLPKPMILVHGWNSDASTWDTIKPQIPALVNPAYKGRVFAVGDGQVAGTMNTNPVTGNPIEQNAEAEWRYIEAVRDKLEAEKVDIVAHSMGGLISRLYIQNYMPDPTPIAAAPYVRTPVVSHLVMLGTPNRGSACADLLSAAVRGIPTKQLTRGYAKVFNNAVINRRGVPMSVMAGDFDERTCSDPEHGDGVVALSSAWSNFTDVSRTFAHHLDEPKDANVFGTWVKAHVSKPATPGAGLAAARTTTRTDDDSDPVVAKSQSVDVAAGATVDVPLANPGSGAVEVAVLAAAGTGSSLVDPSGNEVDAVAGGSERAQQRLRSHRVESPAAGAWKLRLHGGSAADTVAFGQSIEGSTLKLTASSTQADDGRVGVTATFADGGSGVTGATVEATLSDGTHDPQQLTLTDDGNGRYSAVAPSLAKGQWFADVTATRGQDERVTTATTVPGSVDGPTGGGGSGGGGDNGGGDNGGGSTGGGSSTGAGTTTPQPGTPAPAATGPAAVTPSGSAAKPVTVVAKKAATLTAGLVAARDRRAPYAWKLTGTLSVAGQRSCAATKLTVTVRSGKKTLRTTSVAVGSKCGFATTLRGIRKKGRYSVTVAYAGTPTIAAATAKTLAARAG